MEERTPEEEIGHWQSRALQLSGERDQLKDERDDLARTCERLAMKLRDAEQTLARLLASPELGFHTPQASAEEPEPFSS